MIDLRYAAGFFDGEGCIHIARNVRVIVSGCFAPGLLERFAERWGGTVRKAVWAKSCRRPGVRWEITGDLSHRFLKDLLPFLVEKKRQAELGIQYRELKLNYGVRGGKGYNPEQREQIKQLEAQIRTEKKLIHAYKF